VCLFPVSELVRTTYTRRKPQSSCFTQTWSSGCRRRVSEVALALPLLPLLGKPRRCASRPATRVKQHSTTAMRFPLGYGAVGFRGQGGGRSVGRWAPTVNASVTALVQPLLHDAEQNKTGYCGQLHRQVICMARRRRQAKASHLLVMGSQA
jgi:hypothetical protein